MGLLGFSGLKVIVGLGHTASTGTQTDPPPTPNHGPIGKIQKELLSMNNANLMKSPQSSWSTTMARLSSKAGVVATVVIDSSLGSVIQTSGHYSISHSKSSQSANSARPATENGLGQLATGSSDLEELAEMVWKYVKSTEALIADIDSEV